MTRNKSSKYLYDIALTEGAGAGLVSWVTGLMVFFATLALAVNFGLSGMTKNWVTGLSGALTVEIKPSVVDDGNGKVVLADRMHFENTVAEIMTAVKTSDAVLETRRMTENEMRDLIEPWLGGGASIDALPLPALIDVKLKEGADILPLQTKIKTIDPSARIDTHTDTLDDVKTLVRTANFFIFLLALVIASLAVVSIAGIVRAKLMIHRPEVETLHLIGASDEYIARQFRQHTLRGTLKGGLYGLVATFGTLLAIAYITETMDHFLVPTLDVSAAGWVLIALCPLVTASLIAHLTAQMTALKEIAKLP